MHKIFLSVVLILASYINNKPPDAGLIILKQQVMKDILAASFNAVTTMGQAEKLKADGSWDDIDYTDKTRGAWSVASHLARLNDMAVLYKKPGSKWTGDKKLESKIIAGLNFWIKNDFICPNWWYPEIGVPKILGPTMILMEDKLTREQKASGLKILNRAKIGMTGQNKVWLSGNVIYRSLLTNDIDSIRAAVKAIQDEVVVSESEGIQPDFSFHQHGPQQQFGNYGSSFAGDMLKWAIIFQNTPFQFETKKVEILRKYLLQGMRWIIWKNKMDISACGRQLFPDAQAGKAASIKNIMNRMPLIDAAYKMQYETALNDFSGDMHFWKSDMTVHRSNNFYTSVKMSSKRVAGAESCNEENIQGYHLGDGATYFYQSGEEYTNIFPFWDWKLIPGTTTFHDEVPLPVLPCNGYRIESDFVGGISDGTNGLATLAYKRDSLYAQKSWFFFDDEIICLGAGIRSDENKEVTTSINQSFLYGNVVVKQGSGNKILKNDKHALQEVSWVLHDKWGYYFPGKANIELSNRQQSGDWNKVLKRMPAEDIRANIFTLWINHHTRPQDGRYAYYVLPASTTENIERRASSINLVENSDKLQVMESIKKQMAGYVFVQPGETITKTFNKVSSDKSCVMLITKSTVGMNISIADPTHLEKTVTVGFQGKRKVNTFESRFDAGSNMTFVIVSLPQGYEAGRSIRFLVE